MLTKNDGDLKQNNGNCDAFDRRSVGGHFHRRFSRSYLKKYCVVCYVYDARQWSDTSGRTQVPGRDILLIIFYIPRYKSNIN